MTEPRETESQRRAVGATEPSVTATQRRTAGETEPLMDYARHEYPDPVLFDLTLLAGSRDGLSVHVDLGDVDERVDYMTLAGLRLGADTVRARTQLEAAGVLLRALKIPPSPEPFRLTLLEQLKEMKWVINLGQVHEASVSATEVVTTIDMTRPSSSGPADAADADSVTETDKRIAVDNGARRMRLLEQNRTIAAENARLRKRQADKSKFRVLAERIVGL